MRARATVLWLAIVVVLLGACGQSGMIGTHPGGIAADRFGSPPPLGSPVISAPKPVRGTPPPEVALPDYARIRTAEGARARAVDLAGMQYGASGPSAGDTRLIVFRETARDKPGEGTAFWRVALAADQFYNEACPGASRPTCPTGSQLILWIRALDGWLGLAEFPDQEPPRGLATSGDQQTLLTRQRAIRAASATVTGAGGQPRLLRAELTTRAAVQEPGTVTGDDPQTLVWYLEFMGADLIMPGWGAPASHVAVILGANGQFSEYRGFPEGTPPPAPAAPLPLGTPTPRPTEPPPVLLRAQSGEQAGGNGTYCVNGQCVEMPGPELPAEPLVIQSGETVTLDFAALGLVTEVAYTLYRYQDAVEPFFGYPGLRISGLKCLGNDCSLRHGPLPSGQRIPLALDLPPGHYVISVNATVRQSFAGGVNAGFNVVVR